MSKRMGVRPGRRPSRGTPTHGHADCPHHPGSSAVAGAPCAATSFVRSETLQCSPEGRDGFGCTFGQSSRQGRFPEPASSRGRESACRCRRRGTRWRMSRRGRGAPQAPAWQRRASDSCCCLIALGPSEYLASVPARPIESRDRSSFQPCQACPACRRVVESSRSAGCSPFRTGRPSRADPIRTGCSPNILRPSVPKVHNNPGEMFGGLQVRPKIGLPALREGFGRAFSPHAPSPPSSSQPWFVPDINRAGGTPGHVGQCAAGSPASSVMA